jgi:REP element-mobilizing transposase RayT
MNNLPVTHPEFLTITILNWNKLLKNDKYKLIIISAFEYLAKQNRAIIYAFCIMDNHIHIIWQACDKYTNRKNQHSFTKYTAQQFKFDMYQNHRDELENYKSSTRDRKYQFWERNPLAIVLQSREVFFQKLNYIHENPVKASMCDLPEDYYFSSASFHLCGHSSFDFLSSF